ncbi:MAG: hypothetical protein D6723_02250, partial [Acidobacteria bacterium]
VIVGTTQGGNDTATLHIPQDDNGNWLPDGGWLAGTVWIQDFGMAPGNDEDNNGPDLQRIVPRQPPSLGQVGDGLLNFEEYRGFVVRGEHRRTNPFQKDLFISSELAAGIAYAFPNLPTTHWVREDGSEYDVTRVINFNYTNTGYGGNIPGHIDYDQRALRILQNMGFNPNNDPSVLGATFPFLCQYTSQACSDMTPNETCKIEVYEGAFAAHGWSPVETDHMRKITTGHEVGHGIHIEHRPTSCNDGTVTGTDSSIMDAFVDLLTPATYNNYDIGQIRLHLRF